MDIFIVDDSELLRDRISSLITTIPGTFICGTAADVNGAIEGINTHDPELIILDIQIPGGSGIDVLRRVKRSQPSPRVIVLTNCPASQYRSACLDAGADYFYEKTAELDKITATIEKIAGSVILS